MSVRHGWPWPASGTAHPTLRRHELGGVVRLDFPANIQMAVAWGGRPRRARAMAYRRLPLQLPLVVWALQVARGAR